ncbi:MULTISPECIES: hypothetical protein [Virgibacillus]|uniref:YfhS protein n=2 Tax=Virgibacillus TaxID=84406 RepID=A0A024QJH4_9BACI|nr:MULTISPECIES: hypothetical protein [Virgibacillus]MYL43001.1 hypothetical protein [Virgibacillus massiliensis]CDQ42091.1 hypothetical protein BN990_04471 [Virgibacillus massiliensis]
MDTSRRDFTELTMISKTKWNEKELMYFQHALSQLLPYVNSEGLTILHEINKEMHNRKDQPSSPPLTTSTITD